eukprot:769022_1
MTSDTDPKHILTHEDAIRRVEVLETEVLEQQNEIKIQTTTIKNLKDEVSLQKSQIREDFNGNRNLKGEIASLKVQMKFQQTTNRKLQQHLKQLRGIKTIKITSQAQKQKAEQRSNLEMEQEQKIAELFQQLEKESEISAHFKHELETTLELNAEIKRAFGELKLSSAKIERELESIRQQFDASAREHAYALRRHLTERTALKVRVGNAVQRAQAADRRWGRSAVFFGAGVRVALCKVFYLWKKLQDAISENKSLHVELAIKSGELEATSLELVDIMEVLELERNLVVRKEVESKMKIRNVVKWKCLARMAHFEKMANESAQLRARNVELEAKASSMREMLDTGQDKWGDWEKRAADLESSLNEKLKENSELEESLKSLKDAKQIDEAMRNRMDDLRSELYIQQSNNRSLHTEMSELKKSNISLRKELFRSPEKLTTTQSISRSFTPSPERKQKKSFRSFVDNKRDARQAVPHTLHRVISAPLIDSPTSEQVREWTTSELKAEPLRPMFSRLTSAPLIDSPSAKFKSGVKKAEMLTSWVSGPRSKPPLSLPSTTDSSLPIQFPSPQKTRNKG